MVERLRQFFSSKIIFKNKYLIHLNKCSFKLLYQIMTAKTITENHLHVSEPKWFAIRTRFKSEKIAHRLLKAKGINAYLPIRKLVRRYEKKIRYVDMPLINGFVFVNIIKKEYVQVLETEYVAGFLKFGQNLLAIPDEQIKLIHRLLGENIELDVHPTNLTKGDWVEVMAGPLLGFKGRLIQMDGKEKFIVDLVNAAHSLEITIDIHLLKKIDIE
jgi:transcriptional antiterminator RfaH